MSLIADLDLANFLPVQSEGPEETWANPRDTESDREIVFDAEMEIVWMDDGMENQI